jgi:hypothetical protein
MILFVSAVVDIRQYRRSSSFCQELAAICSVDKMFAMSLAFAYRPRTRVLNDHVGFPIRASRQEVCEFALVDRSLHDFGSIG